ncbi:MAG: phosphoribosylformylglycinamidine synthase [Sarcina sp.]
MLNIFFVEKKKGFDVEAKKLLEDFKENLLIANLKGVRVLNKYILKGDRVNGLESILYEPPIDNLYKNEFPINEKEISFAVEYLPGQYDQRADAASECFAILNSGRKIDVKNSKVIVLSGEVTQSDIEKIKTYYINKVDSREVEALSKDFNIEYTLPTDVADLDGFLGLTLKELENLHFELGLAMSFEDLKMIQKYFILENRNPTITEIKVIDTYWSDHCRHTTFETKIENIEIEDGKYKDLLENAVRSYRESRKFVYEDKEKNMTLMDIAIISMKEMKKRGVLSDLDVSQEINACSINVKIETDKGFEDYLLMFKNETHNHPTEIEPFGGAATCLGGAIRDPLSGRTYVYQAMRITGSGDPTVSIAETLEGKLPQRTITLGAAHGYSSYGNQIGLATGEVREIYHPGYVAKRLEIGAVLGAAPKANVTRETPSVGDLIILLGGKTGRDGCGGATGSSKEHTETSKDLCGAEVQKGNPPTERKIQRLFRNKKLTTMIKRCNDFGAGGISVAIGELCDSLDINLDLVPKKYAGLDGTELAISESQERMAVVVEKNDANAFIKLANDENLEATIVAKVTDSGYMRMLWNDKVIVNLKREFLNTNGATQTTDVKVSQPIGKFFDEIRMDNQQKIIDEALENLNITLQKGLVERFDSTIGAGTILMPFGGKYQLSPSEGMACKIPVLEGVSKDCSIMASGFNPYLSSWSPFHGAYYSIVEAVTKIVAMGGKYENIRLTLQEYFEKLGKDKERWGKPFAALLGALTIQKELNIPAIGGKDSMSGSFGNLDVPPTLVAFAVTTEKCSKIISTEFKKQNSKIILIKTSRNTDELLECNEFKRNLDIVYKLNTKNQILAMNSVKNGGLIETIIKMSIGNKIGVKVNNDDLFTPNYGSLVLEVSNEFNFNQLSDINYEIVGETSKDSIIRVNDCNYDIDTVILKLESKLSKVFKFKTEDKNEKINNLKFDSSNIIKAKNKVEVPQVLIPIFPGTNCEYDSIKAFERAGAKVKSLVFKNLTAKMLEESIDNLEKEIRTANIVMIPGGFSAGDEPDGSAKFIATVFRNEKIKAAVTDLLENREGLMLGICNGFQALIKLGLVPYGKIVDLDEEMPTLTYNNIGRHMSSIIQTRIASNKSPWLSNVNIGDIHNVAISHGEGRFVASKSLLESLIKNGQVTTQYVDLKGNASGDMPYNPNGSMMAIEGITSFDGRVFGKMGHSERIGENLYKNIIGEFDQKIFESGVEYFR